MQINTLYWLHMEKTNDKSKFTIVVPHEWGRTAMALSMGTHRASTLSVIVLLKCCDEYIAAILFLTLFWVPEIFHLKPAAVCFTALVYKHGRVRSPGFGTGGSDLNPTFFIY